MPFNDDDPVDGSIQVTVFPDGVAPSVPRQDPLTPQVFLTGNPVAGQVTAVTGSVLTAPAVPIFNPLGTGVAGPQGPPGPAGLSLGPPFAPFGEIPYSDGVGGLLFDPSLNFTPPSSPAVLATPYTIMTGHIGVGTEARINNPSPIPSLAADVFTATILLADLVDGATGSPPTTIATGIATHVDYALTQNAPYPYYVLDTRLVAALDNTFSQGTVVLHNIQFTNFAEGSFGAATGIAVQMFQTSGHTDSNISILQGLDITFGCGANGTFHDAYGINLELFFTNSTNYAFPRYTGMWLQSALAGTPGALYDVIGLRLADHTRAATGAGNTSLAVLSEGGTWQLEAGANYGDPILHLRRPTTFGVVPTAKMIEMADGTGTVLAGFQYNWQFMPVHADDSDTFTNEGIYFSDTQGFLAYRDSGGTIHSLYGSLAIGATITSGTAGSVLFVDGSGFLAQDNSNFFWDDTNKTLGIGTSTPDASARLDVSSTTQGFLPPRMTAAQRFGVVAPAAGLIVYDTDILAPFYWNGSGWTEFNNLSLGQSVGFSTPGSILFVDGSGFLAQNNADFSWDDTTGLAVGLEATFQGPVGVHVWNNTQVGILLDVTNAYTGIAWGNIPSPGDPNTIHSAGLYPNAGTGNLEFQITGGIVSAPGTDAYGKIRPDSSDNNECTIYVGASITLVAGNDHIVRQRYFNIANASTWWETYYDSTGINLQLRYYTSSVLTNTLSFPQASGEIQVAARTKVATDYQLAIGDRFVEVDTSGGIVNLALYPGNVLVGGTPVRIKNLGPSPVQVTVQGSGPIDGSTAAVILKAQYNEATFLSDGVANAYYLGGSDRWAAGDFGVGTGVGATISGLTVASDVRDAALGYLNVRSGVQSGSPATYYENSGNQLRYTFISNGTQLWITPGVAIIAQMTNTGTLGLGGNTTVPDGSCNLELQRTDSGLGLNTLTTTQRNAIASPKTGLTVFNTTTSTVDFYSGSWQSLQGPFAAQLANLVFAGPPSGFSSVVPTFRPLVSADIPPINLSAFGSNGGVVGSGPPTVTGSRGGNAALASLLTGLASLGLITDSTSA